MTEATRPVRVGEHSIVLARGGTTVVRTSDDPAVNVLVVATADGEAFAVENTCPHQGSSLVAGYVSATAGNAWIECPLHAWRFDLDSGSRLVRGSPSLQEQDCLRTYRCGVDELGVIWVDVPPT